MSAQVQSRRLPSQQRLAGRDVLMAQILESLRVGPATALELSQRLLDSKPSRHDTRIHDALASLQRRHMVRRIGGHRWVRADDEREHAPVAPHEKPAAANPGWNKIGISERTRKKRAEKPTEEARNREFAERIRARERAALEAVDVGPIRAARIEAMEKRG